MNYPDGMSQHDWEHIDGTVHYRQCPMHEEYLHDCSKEGRQYIQVCPSPPCWYIKIWHYDVGRHYGKEVRIDFCPWCGEDLGRPECVCAQITADQKEA